MLSLTQILKRFLSANTLRKSNHGLTSPKAKQISFSPYYKENYDWQQYGFLSRMYSVWNNFKVSPSKDDTSPQFDKESSFGELMNESIDVLEDKFGLQIPEILTELNEQKRFVRQQILLEEESMAKDTFPFHLFQ